MWDLLLSVNSNIILMITYRVLLDLKESEVLSEKEVRKVKKESQEKTAWMEHRWVQVIFLHT